MYKVGIFGGAFNPPHKGHIHVAESAIKTLQLNRLLIIPTGLSPHKKKSQVFFQQRLEMSRIAFSKIEQVEVSEIEGKNKGKSFTINTIRELRKSYPKNTSFYLIIGSDMLYSFKNWYKYESILKESNVVAYPRNDREYTDMMEMSAEIGHIKILDIIPMPMSSTLIRRKISMSEDLNSYLSDRVINFINKNHLYRDG